jgi:hypothetical protein
MTLITTTDIALMATFSLILLILVVAIVYARFLMPRPPPIEATFIPFSSNSRATSPVVFEHIELQPRIPRPVIPSDIILSRPPAQARKLPLPDPYLAQTSTFDGQNGPSIWLSRAIRPTSTGTEIDGESLDGRIRSL